MKPQQLPFDLGHRAAFAREDFWVSDSNRDAVAWVDKYPDWPTPFLLIHGAAGCGKTHLLHVFRQETGAAVFGVQGMEDKSVVIDDIDRMIGTPAHEEEIFHLYNTMKENGGHILATAATPQAAWRFVLPDLKSRLAASPAAALGLPDDQLMAVVLTKLFSDRQIVVGQDVVQYILPRIDRTFVAMRALVDAADRQALAEKRAVTVPLVRDMLNAQDKLI
jgi:chromosomal replication initiation ATPase DnaA